MLVGRACQCHVLCTIYLDETAIIASRRDRGGLESTLPFGETHVRLTLYVLSDDVGDGGIHCKRRVSANSCPNRIKRHEADRGEKTQLSLSR